jgi:hypothetical protein
VMVHLLPKARSTRRSKGGDAVPGSNKKASTSCVKDELVDGNAEFSLLKSNINMCWCELCALAFNDVKHLICRAVRWF